MHGFNGDWTFVEPLIDLKREYDIISFDFPGCGLSQCSHTISIESYSKAVYKLLDIFDEPIIVVGHSLGGALAIMLLIIRSSRKLF